MIDRFEEALGDLSNIGAFISGLDSAKELHRLLMAYNWDDGFDVPPLIANHPKCDAGLGLALFWLADGMNWFTGEIPERESNRRWRAFCELITQRILQGCYSCGTTSFQVPEGKVQRYKLTKQGVPTVLFTDVVGEHERHASTGDFQ